MEEITVSLDDQLRAELAKMASEVGEAEDELIREGIRSLVAMHNGPGVPRFARRLGPIALPQNRASADEGSG